MLDDKKLDMHWHISDRYMSSQSQVQVCFILVRLNQPLPKGLYDWQQVCK